MPDLNREELCLTAVYKILEIKSIPCEVGACYGKPAYTEQFQSQKQFSKSTFYIL